MTDEERVYCACDWVLSTYNIHTVCNALKHTVVKSN